MLADKKKEIYDGDIVALIQEELHQVAEEEWSLVAFDAHCGTGNAPHVTLTLQRGDEEFTARANEGDGPIDAAFWCAEKITGIKLVCKDFRVRSASIGRDAQGEAIVEVDHHGALWRGRGVSTDTVEATVKAILNAANRIAVAEKMKQAESPLPWERASVRALDAS